VVFVGAIVCVDFRPTQGRTVIVLAEWLSAYASSTMAMPKSSAAAYHDYCFDVSCLFGSNGISGHQMCSDPFACTRKCDSIEP
jgi:hypothetical protein